MVLLYQSETLSYMGPAQSKRTVTCGVRVGGVRFNVKLEDGSSLPPDDIFEVIGLDNDVYKSWCVAADYRYTLIAQSIAHPENVSTHPDTMGILDQEGNRISVQVIYNNNFPDGPLWNVFSP